MKLDFVLKWLATAVVIVGALFTSLNVYPAGPILLNVGTAIWLVVAILWKEKSLIVVNFVVLVIYTVGLLFKFFN